MDKNKNDYDEQIEKIMLPENQGGELTKIDYFWYMALGLFFPVILLIWGWFD